MVDGSPGCSSVCSILYNGSTAARLSAQAPSSPTELFALSQHLSSPQGRHKPDETHCVTLSSHKTTERWIKPTPGNFFARMWGQTTHSSTERVSTLVDGEDRKWTNYYILIIHWCNSLTLPKSTKKNPPLLAHICLLVLSSPKAFSDFAPGLLINSFYLPNQNPVTPFSLQWTHFPPKPVFSPSLGLISETYSSP